VSRTLALDAAAPADLVLSTQSVMALDRDNGLELIFDEWTGELILSPTNVAFCGENSSGWHSRRSAPRHRDYCPHTLVHQFDFHDRNDMAEVISTNHRPRDALAGLRRVE